MSPFRAAIRDTALVVLCLLAREQADAQRPPADSAALLSARADTAYLLGTVDGYRRAIALWTRAQLLYRAAGDSGGEAGSVASIGLTYARLSAPDSAVLYLRAAIPIFRAQRERASEALARNELGVAYQQLGMSDSALAQYAAAVTAYRELGDSTSLRVVLTNIAMAHGVGWALDSALAYYRKAAVVAAEAGDTAGITAVYESVVALDSTIVSRGSGPDLSVAIRLSIGLAALNDWIGRPLAAVEHLARVTGIYLNTGPPDSAMTYARQALRVAREGRDSSALVIALQAVGLSYSAAGRPDSARRQLRLARAAALRLANDTEVIMALASLATAELTLGNVDTALAVYREALGRARTARDDSKEASLLVEIGAAYRSLGRLDSAEAAYRAGRVAAQRAGDRQSDMRALQSLATLDVERGRPAAALAAYAIALASHREARDAVGEYSVLQSIASLYDELGQRDSALVYYRAALALGRSLADGADGPDAPLILVRIGWLHRRAQSLDSALTYYRQALAALRRTRTAGIAEALVLIHVAEVHLRQGAEDSALTNMRRALKSARDAGDRRSEVDALRSLGMAYYHPFSARTLGRAVAYFDSAAALRASLLRRAGGDANRVSLAEGEEDLFEMWALAWIGRISEVGRRNAVLASLAVAERGRAQALLDLMRGRASTARPGADLAAEGAALARAVHRSGSSALVYLQLEDALFTWFVTSSGEVFWDRTPIGRDSVATLVASVRGGLGVSGVQMQARLTRGGVPLERGVGVRQRGQTDAGLAARALAAVLLPEELTQWMGDAGELVIVPYGALTTLPFAVLPLAPRGEPLGARYAIRYAPSLATLAEVEGRAGRAAANRTHAWRDALVVGNPSMPEVPAASGERVRLTALAGAASEGAWVGARLGVTALVGADATESLVRRRLSAASLVHLATHGVAYDSDARARESFVALAPDGSHDGLLTVGEVLDDALLRLTADLVVLSACQTGLGDLKHSEGMMGLQRAFLAKGARTVLVSLWSVDDVATGLLMQKFYAHWLDDGDRPTKAEALRRAQEEVRATKGYEHPRYWAAFQLVGAR